MADGRRRRWIAVDIDYYAGPLADEIRSRFGPVGLLVFDAYLRACKKHMIEGRVTYSCEPEFLSIIGLPGMNLVDEVGDEWPLDALWTLLADHKQISRRYRGRLTDVISSRWEQWQKVAIRRPPVGENRRSGPIDTGEIRADSEVEICSDLDLDSDVDLDRTRPLASPQADDARPRAKAKRGTQVPEPFVVTDAMRDWARSNVPRVDIERETTKFTNHHAAKGSVFKDWGRAWMNWLIRAGEYARPNTTSPQHKVTDNKQAGRVQL